MVNSLTLSLVRRLAIDLEKLLNLIQHWLFSSIVGGSELLASLKHKVFEIVCQAGSFSRVVLTAHLHGNVGLNTRFFLINRHIDLQPVAKGVNLRVKRVTLDGFVAAAGSRNEHHGRKSHIHEFPHNCIDNN